MPFVRILFFLLFAQVVCAQTVTQQDHIIARQRLRVGLDTSRYWTTIVTVINSAATHRQGTTAKAVRDFILSQGYISVTGTPTTGQTIKYDGTNWVPSTDAGAWEYRTVTTTVGSANFVAFGSLAGVSTDNMRVTRNGLIYKVGASNCTDCQVSFNPTTQVFTLPRSVIAQEIISLQIIR